MDLQLVKLSSNLGVICTDKNFRSSYKNIVYNSEFVLGNIDYFMVDECVRFLFTSCERLLRTSERSERVS